MRMTWFGFGLTVALHAGPTFASEVWISCNGTQTVRHWFNDKLQDDNSHAAAAKIYRIDSESEKVEIYYPNNRSLYQIGRGGSSLYDNITFGNSIIRLWCEKHCPSGATNEVNKFLEIDRKTLHFLEASDTKGLQSRTDIPMASSNRTEGQCAVIQSQPVGPDPANKL